ncbi:MAG: hypothetical protein HY608_03565 [Planctomycetes bacterium]|nr:hypothetical protein [Planctomycetota bacterium]
MAGVLVPVHGRVEWKIFRDPASGDYVGVCDPLKLTASGRTLEAVRKEIVEVLSYFLQDAYQDGDLDEVLRSHGWSIVGLRPTQGTRVRFVPPEPHIRRVARPVYAPA